MPPIQATWAARVLNRHRHNEVGCWEAYDDRVVQVYQGAEVTVLSVAEAVRIARGYEGEQACDADSSQTTE